MPRCSSQCVAVCLTGRIGQRDLASVRMELEASKAAYLEEICTYRASMRDNDPGTWTAVDILRIRDVFIELAFWAWRYMEPSNADDDDVVVLYLRGSMHLWYYHHMCLGCPILDFLDYLVFDSKRCDMHWLPNSTQLIHSNITTFCHIQICEGICWYMRVLTIFKMFMHLRQIV